MPPEASIHAASNAPSSVPTTISAPILFAASACCRCLAEAITVRAPKALATAIEESPIVAEPTTPTISPGCIRP